MRRCSQRASTAPQSCSASCYLLDLLEEVQGAWQVSLEQPACWALDSRAFFSRWHEYFVFRQGFGQNNYLYTRWDCRLHPAGRGQRPLGLSSLRLWVGYSVMLCITALSYVSRLMVLNTQASSERPSVMAGGPCPGPQVLKTGSRGPGRRGGCRV
jgi:hypothetical protein